MKNNLIRATIDGVANSFCLLFIGQLLISPVSLHLNFFTSIGIAILASFIISIIFFLLIVRANRIKNIIVFCTASTFLFSIVSLLHLVFNIRYFPVRETTAADGLVIMFTLGTYLLFSLLLKIVVIVILALKYNIKGSSKTADGFSS